MVYKCSCGLVDECLAITCRLRLHIMKHICTVCFHILVYIISMGTLMCCLSGLQTLDGVVLIASLVLRLGASQACTVRDFAHDEFGSRTDGFSFGTDYYELK